MVAWILIYSAALTMDFAELTGLKQVIAAFSRQKYVLEGSSN